MPKIILVSVAIIALAAAGCAARKRLSAGPDRLSAIPRDIPGLMVRGPRPRRNVIENMTAIICAWRAQCARDRRAPMDGTILLKLTIDKVGDIGVLEFHHTLRDSAFVRALVDGLYLLDFDPWNDTPGNTEIECPVVLFPHRQLQPDRH